MKSSGGTSLKLTPWRELGGLFDIVLNICLDSILVCSDHFVKRGIDGASFQKRILTLRDRKWSVEVNLEHIFRSRLDSSVTLLL